MRSFWHIWQEAISPEVCDQIEAMPRVPLTKGQVGIKETNNNIRKSEIAGFPYNSDESVALNRLIEPFITMANRENFGFRLNNFYEFQYTEYNERNEGFYGWHQDTQWLRDTESQRKLSVTIQLSDDDYEGGDFEFHKDLAQPSDIRRRGTVIVFPSFFYHQVTPVTKGTRKALVGWYEGECFA